MKRAPKPNRNAFLYYLYLISSSSLLVLSHCNHINMNNCGVIPHFSALTFLRTELSHPILCSNFVFMISAVQPVFIHPHALLNLVFFHLKFLFPSKHQALPQYLLLISKFYLVQMIFYITKH